MKRKDGEWIELYYEYSEPSYELVRGHVSPQEAEAALMACNPRDFKDIRPEEIRHGYGRFNPDPEHELAGRFAEVNGPGRGNFKVTFVSFKRQAAPDAAPGRDEHF